MNKRLESAQYYFSIGDKLKAFEVYKLIINENPKFPEAWYGISKCIENLQQKKYCLNRALNLNPEYRDAEFELLRLGLDEKESIDKQKNNNIAENRTSEIHSIIPKQKEFSEIIDKHTPFTSQKSCKQSSIIISLSIILFLLCLFILISVIFHRNSTAPTQPPTVDTLKRFPTYTITPSNSPTPSFTVTPIPTPTEPTIKVFFADGDIGKRWDSPYHSIGLKSVYRTKTIDGMQPSGYSFGGVNGGFTDFIVVELILDYFSPGYEDFSKTDFWLTAYTDDEYMEYMADYFPYQLPETIRVYYNTPESMTIIYEVMPESHNFNLCYQYSNSININTGSKITSFCGATGYEFKFGD